MSHLLEIVRKLRTTTALDQLTAEAIVQAIAEYGESSAPVTQGHLDKRLTELKADLLGRLNGQAILFSWLLTAEVAAILRGLYFLLTHFKP